MNPIWYESASVVVVLMFVGVVLLRAFTAPVSHDADRKDMFMRRRLPGAPSADTQRTGSTQSR